MGFSFIFGLSLQAKRIEMEMLKDSLTHTRKLGACVRGEAIGEIFHISSRLFSFFKDMQILIEIFDPY